MQNLKSLSSSIPLPRKPGSSKQRYIAGVDQTDRVDPWLLADEDSRFAELYGVQLHYKIAHPPTGLAPKFFLSVIDVHMGLDLHFLFTHPGS